VQLFTERDITRCCENTVGPPEDGNVNAQNMLRIVVKLYILLMNKELGIKVGK
jgi:hypothetical protein